MGIICYVSVFVDLNTFFLNIMIMIMMLAGREEEGEMRFYDFKRCLGDKGSKVMMAMMMMMMILFYNKDDFASVCKVKCRRKTRMTKVPAGDDSTSSI